ncbi:MAG TPA: response regulator transcription factor [Solirubrobacteraceae bacterium]|jgi:DNA-binding NarL/FixJ family response regulator|nr:response regulator transcription factor [Solirubrobacteraceae bacterium]
MNDRPPIPIVLARFEDIVSRGLRSLITDDEHLELVAADVPHDRLADALERFCPGVAILNFGSLASTSEIRGLTVAFPATRLVVLANRPTAAESRQMLAFGATACLGKGAQSRDIVHAIHLASRGLHVLPPAGADGIEPAGPELLTPREADVLELLQGGRSNAEIAQTLHVSVETVRTHARRVYRKLGVRTRRELRPRR